MNENSSRRASFCVCPTSLAKQVNGRKASWQAQHNGTLSVESVRVGSKRPYQHCRSALGAEDLDKRPICPAGSYGEYMSTSHEHADGSTSPWAPRRLSGPDGLPRSPSNPSVKLVQLISYTRRQCTSVRHSYAMVLDAFIHRMLVESPSYM